MIWAGVICHKIDQDPHSKLVRVGDEVLILAHRAHVIVDRIEIHGVIAVIIRIGILPYRRQPDCRDAEVVQVLQVLPNAAQVTAVIRHGITSVVFAAGMSGDIVRWVPVGETIGHDEVDHIVLEVPGGLRVSCLAKSGNRTVVDPAELLIFKGKSPAASGLSRR